MSDSETTTRPLAVMIGPPGSGKTTVGVALAERLGVEFRDTDADIERQERTRIGDIFVEYGEAHFRKLEKAAVAAALAEHSGVLSLGAGAILDQDTRALLAGHQVVYLEVGLHDAARRIGMNRDRPLLLGNVRAQLRDLMNARRPLYESVATVTVATDDRLPDDIADEIAARLSASE